MAIRHIALTRFASAALLATCISLAAIAQATHAPAFDVISIRPSNDTRIQMYGVLSDEYRARNVPLGITIMNAYLPMALGSRDRLQGAPPWVWNDNYDFEAKVNSADLPQWEKERGHHNFSLQNKMLQGMLQAALVERCKLVVHPIPTKVPGYALVVGTHGPNWKNLKETKPGEVTPSDAQGIAEGGALVPIMPGTEPVVAYFHTSMASLAGYLSQTMIVENRTGLTGKYDFSLLRLNDDRDPATTWDLRALGLKLEPIKVPAEILVIDHIEKPSSN